MEKALIWLLVATAILSLTGCETLTGPSEVQAPALPRNVNDPNAQPPPEPVTEKANLPDIPNTRRDELSDPRLLAAAQAVGASPVEGTQQPATAEPRNELTDPRLLAAAKAAGITIPPQASTPPEPVAEKAPPSEPTETTAVITTLTIPVQEPVETERRNIPPPPANAPKSLMLPPPPPAVTSASIPPRPPDRAPGPKIPLPSAKAPETSPPPPPPAKEYPISPPDARMIPFYEKQLARENLDPIIKAYYERKLAEAQAVAADAE